MAQKLWSVQANNVNNMCESRREPKKKITIFTFSLKNIVLGLCFTHQFYNTRIHMQNRFKDRKCL